MVDSLWFVLALVLLAVVSVALVLVLVLRREEAHGGRETRTEYLQPNYGQTGGFRVSSAPSNEIIMPYRYWLIEGQVSEIDYDIVPGRRMSLRTARTGQMLYPVGFFDLAFEDVQQYDIDGVTVTQRQNAGRITGISWTREGYEYLLYSLQPEMNMIAGLAVELVTNTREEAVVSKALPCRRRTCAARGFPGAPADGQAAGRACPAPTGLQIFYPTASSSRRRRRMMRFSSREI